VRAASLRRSTVGSKAYCCAVAVPRYVPWWRSRIAYGGAGRAELRCDHGPGERRAGVVAGVVGVDGVPLDVFETGGHRGRVGFAAPPPSAPSAPEHPASSAAKVVTVRMRAVLVRRIPPRCLRRRAVAASLPRRFPLAATKVCLFKRRGPDPGPRAAAPLIRGGCARGRSRSGTTASTGHTGRSRSGGADPRTWTRARAGPRSSGCTVADSSGATSSCRSPTRLPARRPSAACRASPSATASDRAELPWLGRADHVDDDGRSVTCTTRHRPACCSAGECRGVLVGLRGRDRPAAGRLVPPRNGGRRRAGRHARLR
jgi:hypothetical protein